MINRIFSILVLVLASSWPAASQNADANILLGRQYLANRDLTNANAQFAAAVAASPNHAVGNAFYAVSRLLSLPNQPSNDAFLTRLGMSRELRDVFFWRTTGPVDEENRYVPPAGVSAAEGATVLRTNIVPALRAAYDNLARITDTNFILVLTAEETGTKSVTLDYGDILIMRAFLRAGEFLGYTIHAENIDVQLAQIYQFITNQTLSCEQMLRDFPNLLTFKTTSDMAAAKTAFLDAEAVYQQASAFIRHRPSQEERFFQYDEDMAESESQFRNTLTDLRASLAQPVVLSGDTNYILNFARFFDAPQPLRSFLPAFAGDMIKEGTLPDPTFNGIVKGATRSEVEEQLSQVFEIKHPDARAWIVTKGQSFIQTNSGMPQLETDYPPFYFYAKVGMSDYNTITNVVLEGPNGEIDMFADYWEFTPQFSTDWESFDSQAEMDAAFPNGAYKFTMFTRQDGVLAKTLNLNNNSYPSAAPHIRNYDAAQMIDPGQSFTLSWDSLAGGTTNDFIQLLIYDETEWYWGEAFKTPEIWEEGALNGTSTSVTIPGPDSSGNEYDPFGNEYGSILRPGHSYSAYLMFARTVANDRSTPAARGAAAYSKETEFSLYAQDCQYSLSIAGASVSADGWASSFFVTNSGTCAWSAITDEDWIHVSGSGTVSGKVNYTVDANPTQYPRHGWIYVGGTEFMIMQEGQEPPPPKQVWGHVFNGDGSPAGPYDLTFQAYLTAYPEYKLFDWSYGSELALDATGARFQIECSNLAAVWKPGVELTIEMRNYANGQSGVARVTLNGDSIQQIDIHMQAAPFIFHQPYSVTGPVGSTAIFSVAAGGTPAPSYVWRKNGTPLQNGSKYSGVATPTLSVLNVAPADEGNYSVVVSNALGTVTSQTAALTVLVPPSITAQPAAMMVTQGVASVRFSVAASGTAPLNYLWFFNGNPLTDSAKYTGTASGNLTILNPAAADSGGYSARVSNNAGQTNSAIASLDVLVSPMIVHAPNSVSTIQNGSAVFTVMAEGTAPLSYQWKRNGAALTDGAKVSGSRASQLMLLNLTTNDSGATFVVTVSNAAGVTNSPVATLTVVLADQPPQILVQPSNQRVPAGGPAKFAVQASGYPTPTYQWFRDETNRLADGGNISGATNATLVISNVSSNEDNSTYTVLISNTASNQFWSTSSIPATLTLIYPPVIVQDLTSLTVVQGQAASFMAANSGTPPFVYQWFKNSALLAGATNHFLMLTNVQTTDAASYKVVITNLAGSATSSVAALTVLVPPAITAQPKGQTNCAGANITLAVTATGTAPLGYQWLKNEQPVPNGTNATLTLAQVQPGDTGVYAVLVLNGAGEVRSANAVVDVHSVPRLVVQPLDVIATPGGSAQFSALADGTPPLTFQWQKDGADLAGQTAATLDISNVQSNHIGSYRVRVANACGSAVSQSAALQVVNRALQIGSASVAPGGVTNIPVVLVAVGDEHQAVFSLGFNTNALRLTALLRGEAMANGTFVASNLPNGELRVEAALPEAGLFAPGARELAILQLGVAPEWTNTAVIPVVFTAGQVAGTNQAPLPLELRNGAVAIATGGANTQVQPGTGLLEDQLDLAVGPGGLLANQALLVLVRDLGVDSKGRPIQVFNQSGVTNGVPYFIFYGPKSANDTISLKVQYIVLDRLTKPAPRFELTKLELSRPSLDGANGTPIPIQAGWLAYRNGACYLQFPSKPATTYFIQYADNPAGPWTTVFPSFVGNGGWMIWVDNGPPKTDSPPRDTATRFYRAWEVK